MNDHYEFKNSAYECCPKDENGNLMQPETPPVMRHPDGSVMAPYQAQGSQGERPMPGMVPPSGEAQISADGIDPVVPMGGGNGSGERLNVYPGTGDFSDEAYRGSMQQILYENLGQFVVCEFLIGTQNMTIKEGILYSVGRAYITLYDEVNNTYVVCDIYSIKFVTFYLPGERPRRYPSNGSSSRNTRR